MGDLHCDEVLEYGVIESPVYHRKVLYDLSSYGEVNHQTQLPYEVTDSKPLRNVKGIGKKHRKRPEWVALDEESFSVKIGRMKFCCPERTVKSSEIIRNDYLERLRKYMLSFGQRTLQDGKIASLTPEMSCISKLLDEAERRHFDDSGLDSSVFRRNTDGNVFYYLADGNIYTPYKAYDSPVEMLNYINGVKSNSFKIDRKYIDKITVRAYESNIDIIYFNSAASDVVKGININETMTHYIIKNLSHHLLSESEYHRLLENLPCLGKALVSIKRINPNVIDIAPCDVGDLIKGDFFGELMTVVLAESNGGMTDIKIPYSILKYGDENGPFSRHLDAVIRCSRDYIKAKSSVSQDAVSQIETVHGIHVYYKIANNQQPIHRTYDGVASDIYRAEYKTRTIFKTINKIVGLMGDDDLQIPTVLPVILFRLCGGVLMNLCIEDINRIVSNKMY